VEAVHALISPRSDRVDHPSAKPQVNVPGRVPGTHRLKTNKILHGYRRRRHTLTDTLRACAALATLPT
jgi:hypothetical protein